MTTISAMLTSQIKSLNFFRKQIPIDLPKMKLNCAAVLNNKVSENPMAKDMKSHKFQPKHLH